MSHINLFPDDFDQLRGVFDQPIAPSPRFAARLKDELMAEITASDRVHMGNAPTTRLAKGQISRVQTLTASGWQGALMTIAAVLAVLAFSFASLQYVNQRFSDNDNDLRGITYGPLASPTSATPEPTSNWGGNAGKTWALDGPSIGANPTAQTLGTTSFYPDSVEVSGNYLVQYGALEYSEDGDYALPEYGIEVFDLNTNTSRWAAPIVISHAFAVSGDLIFAVKPDKLREGSPDPSGDTQVQLVALSIETGEEVWASPQIGLWSNNNDSWGPVVENGTVYVSDAFGSTFAFDAETGEEIWRFTDPGDVEVPNEAPNGGSIVLGLDSIYIAGPTYNVFEVDKQTGEQLGELKLLDENKSDRDILTLQFNGTTLVAIAEVPQSIGTPVSPLSNNPQTAIYAIDPQNLTTLWSVTFDIVWGNTVLTSDLLIVPIIAADGKLILSTFNPLTGINTAGDVDIPGSGARSNMIAVGSTLFISTNIAELYLLDLESRELQTSQEVFDASSPLNDGMPVGTWNNKLLLTSGNQVVALTNESASTTSPVATPGDDRTPQPTVEPLIAADATATATATPIATIASETGAWEGWGGPGRTWNTGEISPALPGSFVELDLGDILPGEVQQSQVFGDILVRSILRVSMQSVGIEAIDLTTGERLWFRSTEVRTGFASDGERLFIVESAEPEIGLTALDLQTGTELWQVTDGFNFEKYVAGQSPIVADGVVYWVDNSSNVGAYDADTGQRIWRSDISSETTQFPGEFQQIAAPAFAIDAENLYVLRADLKVEALDRATGTSKWTFQFTLLGNGTIENPIEGGFLRPNVQILTSNSTVIVVESFNIDDGEVQHDQSQLWALDAATGIEKWGNNDLASNGNAALANGFLYLPVSTNDIAVFDLSSGLRVTTHYFGKDLQSTYALSSTDNVLYVLESNENGVTLYPFATRGNDEEDLYFWSSTAYEDFDLAPIPQFSGDKLVVALADGTILIAADSIAPQAPDPPAAIPTAPVTPTEAPTNSAVGGHGGVERIDRSH